MLVAASYRTLCWSTLCLVSLGATSCKNEQRPSAAKQEYQVANADTPKLCTAVRGNGQLIWAHFGALARILETEGPISGFAGGSSASITAFLLESILKNPGLAQKCRDKPCSEVEMARRAAFLLKSIYYWLDVAKDSKEVKALNHLATVRKELQGFDLRRLDGDDVKALQAGLDSLGDLLGSPSLKKLINPAFVHFILDPELKNLAPGTALATLKFRAEQAKAAITSLGKFEAKDVSIFLRPGLIDFAGVAELIGVIADFYAGNAMQGSLADFAELLASCADVSVGKLPWELEGHACHQRTRDMIRGYLAGREASRQAFRLDEKVGQNLSAMVTTAALVRGHEQLEMAKTDYAHGRTVTWPLTGQDFRFAYAGSEAMLSRVAQHIGSYPDRRSQNFLGLGPMTWRTALATSPAEPGLAEVPKFQAASGESYYSFGGWSDLSPVQVLKAAGCERVIFVTRRGADSVFATQVAALAGFASEAEQLFALESPTSSFSVALRSADAVLCSDWDSHDGFQEEGIRALIQDTYVDSPMLHGDRSSAPIGCRPSAG